MGECARRAPAPTNNWYDLGPCEEWEESYECAKTCAEKCVDECTTSYLGAEWCPEECSYEDSQDECVAACEHVEDCE
jgi:hypothetical protein